MDFNKLTKLHGIMKDSSHSLLTSAKDFNEIAILDHCATRLMKVFIRELCCRLQGLAHILGQIQDSVVFAQNIKHQKIYKLTLKLDLRLPQQLSRLYSFLYFLETPVCLQDAERGRKTAFNN